ncbi:MAG: hypothetical protein AAGF83_10960 [Cyanobacteria bacterium P01_G01_bin.67]
MPEKRTMNPAQNSFWQKLVALIAAINLLLVLFNLSYLSSRDFYYENVPMLVRIYDPIKGIESHPDTEAYLQTAELLQQEITRNRPFSKETEQLLASLRQQSIYLIEENPFAAANKLATFAKLKHRMEYRLQTRSAKAAFNRFWSQEYLSQANTVEELDFFNHKIAPLLKTNYYRRIDANGIQIEHFWQLDIFFIIFFALEYLSRTFKVAQDKADLSWWDAMMRCWYDLLMLLPLWRWLRILPVAVRIHKSGLFNLEKILAQITHEPAAYISHRASMFLIVRLLNQSQEVISNGAIADLLFSTSQEGTVGEDNKIDKIIDRLIGLTIYQVLPEVQPDIENLLRYSLKGALRDSELYQAVRAIPGLDQIPRETIEQLSEYLAQAAYNVLLNSYTDAEGKIMVSRLSNNFSRTLKQQIRHQATQDEIQVLLSDLLEEWKLNYVINSQQLNPEQTLAEAEQIKSEVTNFDESSY